METPQQASKRQASPGEMVVFGLIAAGAGLYFSLVGLGLVPAPGRANAPGWVVACAGLVFLLGGLAVALQGAAGADGNGRLPAGAPAWINIARHFAVLVVVGCLASVGTWVALRGQADKFSMSLPVVGKIGIGGIGFAEMFARGGFGIGALITWLYFVALARRSLRLLRGAIATAGEGPVGGSG